MLCHPPLLHRDSRQIQLTIKSYADESSVSHIDIISNASGLSTTQENRTTDWINRDHSDRIFGNVQGRSRLFTLSDDKHFEPCEPYSTADLEFLQGKHLKDGTTNSNFLELESLQSYVKNQDQGYGWTAEQIWNFETVNGKRYHTRRVVARDATGQKSERVRLVYDYQDDTNREGAEDDGLAYGDIRGD